MILGGFKKLTEQRFGTDSFKQTHIASFIYNMVPTHWSQGEGQLDGDVSLGGQSRGRGGG